jgi:hypothetical protein
MAAGLSKIQIASRVRTRLKKIARDNGGDYVPGTAKRKPLAEGSTSDGLRWEVHFQISRASNGETFGLPIFDVWSDDVPHSERHTLNGLTGDLQSALETFRAAREQALAYVVLPGRAGGPGDLFDVGAGGMTDDLGRARWAQLQTGNVWNLWLARKLDESRVRIIREYPFTDSAGIAAMDKFIAREGESKDQAQASRDTRPALSTLKREAFNRIFVL